MTLKINKLILPLLFCIPGVTFALQSDLKTPCSIDSDQAVFNKQDHQATFTGHVVATQGTTKATGNKVVITLNKSNQKITQIIISGKPATYQTILKKNKEHLHAKADIIKYYPVKALITLEKHAKVTRNGDSISSNQINFNINTETLTSHGSKKDNSQTMIIIHPDNMR